MRFLPRRRWSRSAAESVRICIGVEILCTMCGGILPSRMRSLPQINLSPISRHFRFPRVCRASTSVVWVPLRSHTQKRPMPGNHINSGHDGQCYRHYLHQEGGQPIHQRIQVWGIWAKRAHRRGVPIIGDKRLRFVTATIQASGVRVHT